MDAVDEKVIEQIDALDIMCVSLDISGSGADTIVFAYEGAIICEKSVRITVTCKTGKFYLYVYLKDNSWFAAEVEHQMDVCPFCHESGTFKVCSIFNAETVNSLFEKVYPFVRLRLLYMQG